MSELRSPWMVAAWPGMGGVAMIAGGTLVRGLGMAAVSEIEPHRFFELERISVAQGLAKPANLPRTVVHARVDPQGVRDLVVVLGERQPTGRTGDYAHAVLAEAERLGVVRMVTFAAMATPVDPRAPARVFAAATSEALRDEAVAAGAVPLLEGEISGLNGSFLALAHERGIEGLCLLGEFPFYAGAVANPKASAAALRVFGKLSGLALDLHELDADGKRIEAALVQHLERLEKAMSERHEEQEFPAFEDEFAADEAADEDEPFEAEDASDETPEPPPVIPSEVAARLEALFAQAAHDRDKALDLKAELDRQGLFKHFEDRFLDLFKKAE